MEKSTTTSQSMDPPPDPVAAEKPSAGIKRKPVTSPLQGSPRMKEIAIEQDWYGTNRQDTATTTDTIPPWPPAYTQHTHHHAHGTSPTLISRLRTRWSLLTRRTKILLIITLTLLFVLIIGLSAGLSLRRSRTANLPLPTNRGGPYTGDLTYYDPALGACGYTNSGSDSICAVSHILFDAVSTSTNPNANPLCGKKLRVRLGNKSVDLTVVDRCTGCEAVDIDTTRAVFGDLADIDEGRLTMTWAWLENVDSGAADI